MTWKPLFQIDRQLVKHVSESHTSENDAEKKKCGNELRGWRSRNQTLVFRSADSAKRGKQSCQYLGVDAAKKGCKKSKLYFLLYYKPLVEITCMNIERR